MVSYNVGASVFNRRLPVLILIVMDNGLLHLGFSVALNKAKAVLILIVMDNGLLPPAGELVLLSVTVVLILIVMDNGLLLFDGSNREFNSPLS